jgi:hypothetical protein
MRVLLPNGEPDPRLTEDPRLSAAQKDAAVALAGKDPRAAVEGLDSKMRPVVSARLDGPSRKTETAFMRNGAPAKPVPPMTETWRAAPRS